MGYFPPSTVVLPSIAGGVGGEGKRTPLYIDIHENEISKKKEKKNRLFYLGKRSFRSRLKVWNTMTLLYMY